MAFIVIFVVGLVATFWLGWRTDRRARRSGLPGPARAVVRLLLAAFHLAVAVFPVTFLVSAVFDLDPDAITWPPLTTATYIWIALVLPPVAAVLAARWVVRRVRRLTSARTPTPPADAATPRTPAADPATAEAELSPAGPQVSRRQAIRLAVAAVPPLVATGVTGVALWERSRFRIRHLTVPVTGLPRDLDGLTVTHLTDLHVGNFFPADAIPDLIAAVDSLRPEVVVFTGDLIDRGQFGAIPGGFKLIDHLVRKYDAFAMIEGNHDVLGNAELFEQICKEHARRKHLPDDPSRLLLDEGRVVYPRGRGKSAVELLGLSWGKLVRAGELSAYESNPDRTVRVNDDAQTAAQVRALAATRTPTAFPILLAHHPHAFDAAAAAGLPLTLAGHSHGGQIMLADDVGVGPVRFKYWAGVHERDGCRLSISNGLGAWFPLRVNAPAEIVHLTLKCPDA